jgi:hypothetical protein
MDPKPSNSWISQLPTELLLRIYQCDLPAATLAQCVASCKQWEAVASLILYKHVVLDIQSLSRWTESCPVAYDATIETLTLRITDIQGTIRQPRDETMRRFGHDLDQLSNRVRHMVKLQSFSIHAPERLPRGIWVPEPSLAAVLDNIPGICTNLEIDISDTRDFDHPSKKEAHLCSSIRRLLPQLQFLRLSLPSICPEAFGTGFNAATLDTEAFEPAQAPGLQQFTTKLFGASAIIKRSHICEMKNAPVVKTMVEHLQTFASRVREAGTLQKLWAIDALPQKLSFTSYAAFVRRDILGNQSQSLPMKNIAPGRKPNDGFLIRMPEEDGRKDLLSTLEGVQVLAERDTWVTAINGTRLPDRVMVDKFGLTQTRLTVRDTEEWRAISNISTMLWAEESTTGLRLLEAETGDLMEDRASFIRVPKGWRRDMSGIGLLREE